MRGTKTVLAVMALSAVGTTSIALSVLTHQELSVELRPGGIQLETPAAVDDPQPPAAEQAPDAGEPAPDEGSASTSPGQGSAASPAPESPVPLLEPAPAPVETVAPAPANPVTPPAATGRPEDPGSNGNGGQNPNSGAGNSDR